MKRLFFICLAAFILPVQLSAKTVRYELAVTQGPVNMSGKKTVDWALMVNGGIPAPTLEFTEGDDAEIVVNNKTKEEVSTHWHGILLPPLEDGVPYVNTPPILAGESRVFRFKIRQHGTYWYHSHTMVQEQKGLYGAIVIHPKEKTVKYDKDVVVVISDWSDENADQILRNLRKDGDFYLYKKNSMRSYFGAAAAGGLGTLLSNEWRRMGGMDLSDVGYDAFLINGKRDSQLLVAHPGEKIRLRIINAAASSYFYVSLGQDPFQVISADGVDTKPVWAKEILMGMAETYDILFTVPEHKNFELRATSQDVTGFASGWIGMGEKVFAPAKPLPDLYAGMDHSKMTGMDHEGMGSVDHANRDHSQHAATQKEKIEMDHGAHAGHTGAHGKTSEVKPGGPVVDSLSVDGLRALTPTVLPKNAPVRELKLVLDGDMERYIWHINGKAIHEDRILEINEGELVRFTFVNETMMHHPMHLHGHFFRVLNQGGDLSPLKHTVDVPPHGTRVIEFYANEPGQWMLHCHNLYHMKTGMGRVVRYNTHKMSPELEHLDHQDHHLHDPVYWDAALEAASNHGRVFGRLSKTWGTLELEAEAREQDKEWELEGDLLYRRWLDQYFNFVAGGSSFGENQRATAGVAYLLPLLIETQLLIDHRGDLRLDVEKRFQWTKTIFTDAEFTFRQKEKAEWEISLMYGPSWHWAAGAMLTEDKIGGGVQVKF
jgi:FtsP/CotA-like multicopper oxidase with cupredoxin domain